MSDFFYIEGTYCMDGQCDTYIGEVSMNDVMLGKFSLNSSSGKEAVVNLNMITFDVNIAIDDHNGKTIKRELKDLECITKDDGSWYINKSLGNDKFETIIRQS
ncbi:hypothetical protein [Candidatus Wolbachia massiliensis]|uniref:Uncharacterized protein n=1 Tax=Candidatus Wolbachia massiliensis TaxID=1845000 RepID=A0A7L7YMI6_9RICK|nr:hypothetical protein [Candidatus Wolbachia massiliensis]QOD38278.1 hypothetical protein ID128_05915 [Candidatus Wolbachia massiliensis]